jgi:thiamine transport system substrate-binding protein
MLKNTLSRWLAAILLPLVPAISASAQDLVVYTYDSFNTEWGPGPVVFKAFEEQCSCSVQVIAPGDSGSVLSRTILEKANPKADILLGVNDSELAKSFRHDLWEPYRSPNLERVPEDLQLDPKNRVTPFDYGYIAFVYDSERLDAPPKSLEELTDPRFRGKVVIESPKTSSPGLSMLHWTIAVYGEERYLEYWDRLRPNLLTITDGWSAAYGMFTKGEVPLVLSYVTSPAYHVEYEQTERYKALDFSEGMFRQVEFAGILKGARNPERAREFIDFMLTSGFQDVIPLTNWMYPVAPEKALPDSYRAAVRPAKTLTLPPERVEERNDRWLRDWSRTMAK